MLLCTIGYQKVGLALVLLVHNEKIGLAREEEKGGMEFLVGAGISKRTTSRIVIATENPLCGKKNILSQVNLENSDGLVYSRYIIETLFLSFGCRRKS